MIIADDLNIGGNTIMENLYNWSKVLFRLKQSKSDFIC